MSLSLPLEVIEETIQYLYDDMPTLRVCALVHSSWTPACRAHLFHTVRVARPAKLLASEQATTDTTCRTKLHALVSHIAQLRALVDLLESGPHLRPLIRHLHWALDRSDQLPCEVVSTLFPRVRLFRLEGRHLHWPTVASLPELEELELGVVTELTGSIPSDPLPLRALTIPGVVRVGISRAELWPALAGLVRADTLKVLKLPPEPMFRLFESPTSWLMGFVSTLRALDELWIDFGTFWMMTKNYTMSMGTIPVNLLHLRVQHRGVIEQALRLLRHSTFPALRRLTVHVHCEGEPSRVSKSQRIIFSPLQGVQSLEECALPAAMANRLESVVLEMPDVGRLVGARGFLGLFGAANRPEVLRLVPDDVELVD